MVAYTDRTRLMRDEYRKRVCVGAMVAATVLVDGTVRGTWRLRWARAGPPCRSTCSSASSGRRDGVAAEADRLLAFAAATSDTRTVALPR